MTDPEKRTDSGLSPEGDPTHHAPHGPPFPKRGGTEAGAPAPERGSMSAPAAGSPSPSRGGMETAAPPVPKAGGIAARAAPWAPRPALARVTTILAVVLAAIAFAAAPRPLAAEQASDVPAWLGAHVGDGDGEIALVVLQRARALYLQKVSAGVVRNPCYFAMDATRPGNLSDGRPGSRFYIVCEASQSFRAISSGHGSGRRLPGIADYSNGRTCAKNFGNAEDSSLTTGGAYVTAEIKTSFKGYYRVGAHSNALLARPFLQFDGEGDTANARKRVIGGHAAVVLHGVCMLKDPASRYANDDGYVPRGTLVSYVGGRSNGCTSWSPADADAIMAMTKDDPTTVYIYPEAADIDAVAHAVAAGRSLPALGLTWDASCLKAIGAPKFWPDETLGPLIAQYRKDHPPPPPRPTPVCKVQ